jgi:quinol monooxygenase YgiN
MFMTAVDPDDIARLKEVFAGVVRPAFQGFEGCRGIELYIGLDEHSGDLADVATLSRWESPAALEQVSANPDYHRALAEINTLFQQAPIVHHFEAAG